MGYKAAVSDLQNFENFENFDIFSTFFIIFAKKSPKFTNYYKNGINMQE